MLLCQLSVSHRQIIRNQLAVSQLPVAYNPAFAFYSKQNVLIVETLYVAMVVG